MSRPRRLILEHLSQRLLTVLQLTRMALVFTAISNSLCTLALATRRAHPHAETVHALINLHLIIPVAIISIGLYGFGMSLNDIIDRRRDRQIAAHRPLPSGRIHLITAHVICAALGLAAVFAGIAYAQLAAPGWKSFILLIWTAFLIVFYDFAGKYLVATGLLTLGLIRFFHALIPAPEIPLVWHPLLLFTHVTIISAICYVWEEKRPALTRLHWWAVFGGVALIDLLIIAIVAWKTIYRHRPDGLWIKPGLVVPFALAGVFALIGYVIRTRSESPRQAGQTLILTGLLWLIAYDAAFALVYVGWIWALALLLLLPLSYLFVQIMRWWARLVLISQAPDFKRARTASEMRQQGSA